MTSAYDENGRFLGMRVDQLTDGPIPNEKIPYGTMKDIDPAQGINQFQNDLHNAIPYYGIRTVFHEIHGTVKQVLVMAIGGLAWTNTINTSVP